MIDLYAHLYALIAASVTVLLCGWIVGQLRDDYLNHEHQQQLEHTYRRRNR